MQINQGFWFTPVIEPAHDGAFITENQYGAIQTGHMNRVPLMIGICSEEQIWWGSSIFPIILFRSSFNVEFLGTAAYNWNVKYFDGNISALVNHNMKITNQDGLVKAGNAIRKIYSATTLENKPGSLIRVSKNETTSWRISRYHRWRLD